MDTKESMRDFIDRLPKSSSNDNLSATTIQNSYEMMNHPSETKKNMRENETMGSGFFVDLTQDSETRESLQCIEVESIEDVELFYQPVASFSSSYSSTSVREELNIKVQAESHPCNREEISWICSVCTLKHSKEESNYLTCSSCFSPRYGNVIDSSSRDQEVSNNHDPDLENQKQEKVGGKRPRAIPFAEDKPETKKSPKKATVGKSQSSSSSGTLMSWLVTKK